MSLATDFSPKDPGEIVALAFDFTRLLTPGETFTDNSGTWSVEDMSGNLLPLMKSGSAVTAFPLVKQLIVGGTDGEAYLHRATVQTSAGQTLILGSVQRVMKGGLNG